MLTSTRASVPASNAHARMEAEEDPCLENAHAHVEGAGCNGAPVEGRGLEAMPMLVSRLSNRLLAARGANLTLPTEGQPANSSPTEV